MQRSSAYVRSGVLLVAALVLVLLGRPVVAGVDCTCAPCDFDMDGDVDITDFGHLQLCLSGYGVVQLNPLCQDAKLAGHPYVDQQDIAIFASCMLGDQRPYPGMELPAVVISEFVASNDSGLADEDGEHSDWIELHVPCQSSVNLEGWGLTDERDQPLKWVFPAVTMARGDYLVVFASGKDRRTPGQPLHANFQLDKGGEYLALVAPDGHVVHAYDPKYPDQLTNLSYGLAEVAIHPVIKGAQARYHVPTQADAAQSSTWMLPDFQDGGWNTGMTGLGFSSLPSLFTVTVYRANVFIGDLNTAEAVLASPASQTGHVTAQLQTINFWNSGAEGHFVNNQPYPGMDLVTDVDNFVVLVTGSVVIPYAGEWTFGINSDDGFSLTLTQGSKVFTSQYPSGRGASDTLATFNITSPGIYQLRMVQFEGGGGSSFEFFAAPGYYETFDASVFRLVGDVANGGVGLGGVGWDVLTDLGPEMEGINSSLWARLPFQMDDLSAYSGMKLRIRYADGFVAYLNGQRIAARNAPATLAWNSAATAKRTDQQASVTEDIDLAGYYPQLKAGTNVLAIQGLNDTAADGDFAIVPELIVSDNSTVAQYFTQPTPGQPNSPGLLGYVKAVDFDQQRGFRTDPFQLTLSCPTEGTTIYYTLDGSTPSLTNGTLYAGPIPVNRTSVVRAGAFKSNWLPAPTMTHTYLFLADILQQSPNGEAPGPAWPAPGTVNDQVINYGMDPQIINDPRYSALMDDALLAIPSISLVTDLPNLFSPSTGIYTHATNDGRAWERPCSVELINPSGAAGFQINGGVRTRGGFSRGGWNPKHGFRLLFRSEYGQRTLDYPLFESEGVESFKKVDLRCEQNYSWHMGDSRDTAVRDIFCRDTVGAMGEPYSRSRYYHLYLDGQYWGLYSTEERMEADYAASYFGGDDSDYDAIKQGSYATDGDTNAWYRLWQACQTGFATDELYYKVQGLNVDGTRNPDYEVLVDVDNTIDCAIITYFSGDLDGPISAFGSNESPNNFVAIRNRDGQSGFKCFKHDCEHTLLNENEDRTGPWPLAGNEFWKMNPQYLSQCLAAHPEYRMRFADRVQKFMFGNGVMTVANNQARLQARAAMVQLPIIAESARWGDAATEPPLNRDDHWVPQINWIENTYFPVRNNIVVEQFKGDGLYPAVPAPTATNYGGQVPSGTKLLLSKPAGATGTIYYTTDGTDPRLRDGGLSASAQAYNESVTSSILVPAGSAWRYLDTGQEQAGWRTAGFVDTNWAQGNAQLGYSPDELDEVTKVGYGPDANNKYATTWFRKTFTVPAGGVCTSLTLRVLVDDGVAVYLNNHTPVTSATMPTTWTSATYCSCVPQENVFVDYPMDTSFLNIGNQNLLAVEVHQCGATSTDLSFDLELDAVINNSTPIIIDHNMTLKARVLDNGVWSALLEAKYITQPVGLVINEFMADNATTMQDPDEPGEYPDWIEIYNPNPVAVDMGGMYLTDDFTKPTKFQIATGVSVPANGYLVFFADDDGTQGNLHTNFALSKGGERIRLAAADGMTVIDEIVFGAQTTDISFGRSPNGGATWGAMAAPTPGFANSGLR